ncbi:MAG TPA: hypothetical protein VMX38_03900 [Verrucomicrobiae bacterium]|jgi:hypothetical protein|nr:hypothetical protein [Verrucomicrobiae bacterium]
MKRLALILALASSFAVAQSAKSAPSAARTTCAPALRDQMKLDNIATQDWTQTSYLKGVMQGALLGAGGMLLIVGVLAEIRKNKQPSASESQPLTRAASV